MTANQYIDIHTHKPSKEIDIQSIINWDELDCSRLEGNRYLVSLGLHPWNIPKVNVEFTLREIEQYSTNPNIVAVGEIGLDKLVDVSLEMQEKVFTTQLQFANRLEKPVIIHCVKAFSELLRIRKQQHTSIPWILHGFRNNEQIGDSLIKSGCYLSFGKALLQQENLQRLFQKISDHQYFLETDDSNISIKDIYLKAAELKNKSVNELMQNLQINYENCF
ncbi:TatD family hydrolase [Ancylomarina longa]|nr:TatD family hydrolase [Ancylomarina longa]